MKRTIAFAILLSASFFTNVQAMSVFKAQTEITMSVAEQMLDDQPVLVKGEDNSIGVVAEDLVNFPRLPNDDIYENSDTIKTSRDKPLTLPSSEKSTQPAIINLDGVATRIVLADFQQQCLDVLRNRGKNPKAIFKKNTQIVVTPDGSEKLVDVNIAVWKLK